MCEELNSVVLCIKQFNEFNITIYGTFEQPLFKTKDIYELLGDNYSDKNTVMLTEQELFKLLIQSEKSTAKLLLSWIFEIIKQIQNEKLESKIQSIIEAKDNELKAKENELEAKDNELEVKENELQLYKNKTYEEIDKPGHVYVIKTDSGIKIGKTKDVVEKRIENLQTGNINDIEIILDFNTSNPDLLERSVHYILDRYKHREFFDCDQEYIKKIVEIIGKILDTLKSSYQHIRLEDLTRIIINKLILSVNENYDYDYDFYKWLDENVEEKKQGVLKLKDVCELYNGKTNISPRVASKHKLDIEKYIQFKYITLDI